MLEVWRYHLSNMIFEMAMRPYDIQQHFKHNDDQVWDQIMYSISSLVQNQIW